MFNYSENYIINDVGLTTNQKNETVIKIIKIK
jgi:hypothetical protein